MMALPAKKWQICKTVHSEAVPQVTKFGDKNP
jgi:hypothetical protein